MGSADKKNLIGLEARFYCGVNQLDSNQPLLAIQEFQNLNQMKPDFKHLAYIMLSIAYRRVNQPDLAFRVLTKGLKFFGGVPEMYLVRGQVSLTQRQYGDAVKDFKKFNSMSDAKGAGYLGLGDAYKQLRQFKESLACYNMVCNETKEKGDPFYFTALERRGLLFFTFEDY